MSIISVLNPKGGSGKTTISTNLARSLHERGHSVLLVDSDPQGSARDWHAANEHNPIELVALDRANNVKTLTSMAAGCKAGRHDRGLHQGQRLRSDPRSAIAL
jgi:chromosome partitioning protein